MNSRTDTYYNNQSSGYKAGKYKNLVQHFESKFNQIRRDLPKPEFLRESDLPDESKIIDDLRVSGTDYQVFEQELAAQLSKYFDELRAKSLTYQTEEELKGDVSRLMLLNDQEGLKLRFAQLYRERDNVITHAKDQIQKIHPIERQKTILQLQLSNTLKHFTQNTEQFSGYLNLIEERYQETEGELLDELREKMSVIEGLQENRNQMEETIDQLKKQFDDANAQRQEEHKHRVETDSKMKEVADENAKLRQNYDVLKEHEMSIIRDCENRKQQEIKA
jgi:chromosome segregation ATPase